MDIEQRMHKLRNGTDTAQWAAAEIDRLSAKLVAMEIDANRYRFIRKIGGITWTLTGGDVTQKAEDEIYDSLVDDEIVSRGYVALAKPAPADKTKYKTVNVSDLPMECTREHLLSEAANRADYFFRQVDGSYSFPAPDGQVSQIIEMLLAAANMPRARPARITEQDAREIISNFLQGSGNQLDDGDITHWLIREGGRTLLNKLNADREQVPAVAVPDAIEMLRNMADHLAEHFPPSYHLEVVRGSLVGDARKIIEDYEAAPSHSQQSARSLQDYAIEHAEYMAVNGEQLIDYLNEIANEDDGVLVPDERFSDYVRGLRSGIYEFRKRRDRCQSHESGQSASPAPDSEGEN